MSEALAVSPKLKAKLKKTELEVQYFVAALQKKIVKLQKENADLEVENMLLNNRINSLPSDIKGYLAIKKNVEKLSDTDIEKIRTTLNAPFHG